MHEPAPARPWSPRRITLGPFAAANAMPQPTSIAPCSFEPTAPHDTPRYDRDQLPGGAVIAGPAIIEDAWSTIVVPPGYVVGSRCDGPL